MYMYLVHGIISILLNYRMCLFFFFYMLVFQIRYGCNGKNVIKNISGISGSLVSPGYPKNYPNNVNYTWILNTGHDKATVNFTFDSFDIVRYHYYSCTDDFLEITEKDPCCYIAMHRCGQFGPFSLSVNGRLIRISFVSDELHTAKGFRLRWTVSRPASIKTTTQTTKITAKTTKAHVRTTKTSRKTMKITTLITKITTQTAKMQRRTTLKTTAHKSTTNIFNTKHATIETYLKTTLPLLTIKTTRLNKSTSESKSIELSSRNMNQPPTVTKQISTNEYTTTLKSTDEPPTFSTIQIVSLATGIGVIEINLVVVGIYIVKRHRKRSARKSNMQDKKDTSRHISLKTVPNVDNVYECIPMEHFQDEDIKEEGMYVDLPQNIYDKAFERRPHVNTENTVYQL